MTISTFINAILFFTFIISSQSVEANTSNTISPIADAGSDITICEQEPTFLDGSNSSTGINFIYSWSPGSTLNDSTSITPLVNPISTTEYILTVTDTVSMESNSDTVLVTVIPVQLTPLHDSICPGEEYYFAGQNFNSPGVYQIFFVNYYGCDSIVELTLTEFNPDVTLFATEHNPAMNESFCVDIKVKGFTDILGWQYQMNWDTAHLKYDSITGFNLSGLDNNDFGTTGSADGKIITSWIDAPPYDGETVPDSTTVFQVCFTVVGQPSQATFFEFGPAPTGVEFFDINGILITYKFINGKISNDPCTAIEPINWTGGTSIWNMATNWDMEYIPHACNDIKISSGNASVPTGTKAWGKTLEVEMGAILNIAPGAELTIE